MTKRYDDLKRSLTCGLAVIILLIGCSSINKGLRHDYQISEDTFDKKYIIDGKENYVVFPNYKRVSADEMRYSLRTELEEEGDSVGYVNSIEIVHMFFYDVYEGDSTTAMINEVILEESDAKVFLNDGYSELYMGDCCKLWHSLSVILPIDYYEDFDSNRDMLVKLLDTENNYEWIIAITPEMRAIQKEGFKALMKQLYLEKDDGVVNVIRQTNF